MKILILGHSMFRANKSVGEDALPQNRVMPERDAALGGRPEFIVKFAWPNENLPDVVEKWIAEEQPDVVLLLLNEFWFNYRSAPQFVERKFGPVGQLAGKAGARIGRNPRLAYSGPFQKFRKLTQARVGADAFFEPDHVVSVVSDVLRRIMRSEGVVPLVVGPMGRIEEAISPAFRVESARRRARVAGPMADFCATHHITYWGPDSPEAKGVPQNVSRMADDLHPDADGMDAIMAYISPLITKFLVQVMTERRAASASHLA